MAMTDAIERCDAVVIARHCLAIDDAGARAQSGQGLDDSREACGQVVSRTAVEFHPLAVLAGDDPEAVVLDFVQPQITRRRPWSFSWEARRDEPGRQGTVTQKHGR